ncbi:MAG: hypothetical protein RBT74_02730 [Tenuifilaceae bacterium]|jgi:hypothetical protein|nr:hypothetical protein [Tenuifilaceae bacterium]
MDNPYSVSLMREAYKELVAEKAFAPGKTPNEAIVTTHLYVRFLPSSLDELYLLTDSLNLMLFDHCLTYEIEQEGEYYHDPSIPEDQITWQYTTVEANFNFPEVQYEVIEECYIPDDNEYEKNTHLAMLEERALRNAGYLEMLKRKGFADAENHTKGISLERPTGTILFQDINRNNASSAAKGITVRCWVGAKIGRGVTNDDGDYSCSAKFRVGPYYRLYFYRNNDWSIKHNTISLMVAKNIGLGYHNKKGYDKTFTAARDKDDIPFCIVSTAAHDYFKWCDENSILKPPTDLRIWVASFWEGGSAPMLKRGVTPMHNGQISLNKFFSNIFLAKANSYVQVFNSFTKWVPDITLNNKVGPKDTTLYRTTLHELAHASHYSKVGLNYWNFYTSYIVTCYIDGKGTYGNASLPNSGYCGVGEMWGYYIGGVLAAKEYSDDNWHEDKPWFRPRILRQLTVNAIPYQPHLTSPLTEKQIFDCLTSNVTNHEQLRTKLISAYGKQQEISAVFTHFGF